MFCKIRVLKITILLSILVHMSHAIFAMEEDTKYKNPPEKSVSFCKEPESLFEKLTLLAYASTLSDFYIQEQEAQKKLENKIKKNLPSPYAFFENAFLEKRKGQLVSLPLLAQHKREVIVVHGLPAMKEEEDFLYRSVQEAFLQGIFLEKDLNKTQSPLSKKEINTLWNEWVEEISGYKGNRVKSRKTSDFFLSDLFKKNLEKKNSFRKLEREIRDACLTHVKIREILLSEEENEEPKDSPLLKRLQKIKRKISKNGFLKDYNKIVSIKKILEGIDNKLNYSIWATGHGKGDSIAQFMTILTPAYGASFNGPSIRKCVRSLWDLGHSDFENLHLFSCCQMLDPVSFWGGEQWGIPILYPIDIFLKNIRNLTLEEYGITLHDPRNLKISIEENGEEFFNAIIQSHADVHDHADVHEKKSAKRFFTRKKFVEFSDYEEEKLQEEQKVSEIFLKRKSFPSLSRDPEICSQLEQLMDLSRKLKSKKDAIDERLYKKKRKLRNVKQKIKKRGVTLRLIQKIERKLLWIIELLKRKEKKFFFVREVEKKEEGLLRKLLLEPEKLYEEEKRKLEDIQKNGNKASEEYQKARTEIQENLDLLNSECLMLKRMFGKYNYYFPLYEEEWQSTLKTLEKESRKLSFYEDKIRELGGVPLQEKENKEGESESEKESDSASEEIFETEDKREDEQSSPDTEDETESNSDFFPDFEEGSEEEDIEWESAPLGRGNFWERLLKNRSFIFITRAL